MSSTTDINNLLYDREQQLLNARDDLLRSLEVNYINYIHSLLLTKWLIAERIRRQYDELIRYNTSVCAKMIMNLTKPDCNTTHPNDSITPQSETATPSTNVSMAIHHTKPEVTPSQQRVINLRSIWESSEDGRDHETKDNNADDDVDEDDDNDSNSTAVSSSTASVSSSTPPFMAHMTIEEAEQLSINDMIDHRDIVGCCIPATIVDKKGSNLKINYPAWGDEWDIWSDYHDELYKFARYNSISDRRSHRLLKVKEGDLVDINPIRHKGWKIGQIKELDPDSGQLKIAYRLDEYCHYVWTHIDNTNEIDALHTHTQQNVDNKKQEKYQSASFACLYCEYSFTSNVDLRHHIQSIHPERKALCKHCPYASNRRDDVERHSAQHNNHEAFKCTLCTKLFECNTAFAHKGALTSHLRRVHKVNDYDDMKKDEKKHKTKHKHHHKRHKKKKRSKKRPYNCIHCNGTFSSQNKLKKHIQKKHSERKFWCSYCTQAFLNQHDVTGHEVQHTMKREFECKLCKELFGCRTGFKHLNHHNRHVKSVHKVEAEALNRKANTKTKTKMKTSVSGHKRPQSMTPMPQTHVNAPVPKKMKLSQIIKGNDSV
eukprot:271355_1